MDELYLDNIDEYVNDHNKIVTYKWLSLTLGVHVNTAKQMLFHYLDHKRKETSAQLHATYLVSGKFVDNGQTCHKVSVIREEQLEDVKAKMSLIASVHVYSIQKALLKDSGPLYGVDYDAVRDNLKNCSRFSAIRCSSAVPMSTQELQQVKEMQQPPTSEPEPKKTLTNGKAAVPSKSVKPQKGIMGMFNKTAAKAQNSTKEIKTEEKDSPVVEAPKSKAAPKPNSLMSMFENQSAKKADKVVKEETPAAAAKPAAVKPATAKPAAVKPAAAQSSTSASQPQNKLSHKEEKQEAKAAKPQKESKSKNKRIQDSDSEDEKMEKKKRRRIKKPEPDSSDEEVIPDSPQKRETKEPSPSPEKQPEPVTHSLQEKPDKRVRKRRRVMKSKTFVDDEGCIVTEKAYQSESYSESEEDFKAPKQATRDPFKGKLQANGKDEKKSQKKASANTNKSTKQASIMGFFQKK